MLMKPLCLPENVKSPLFESHESSCPICMLPSSGNRKVRRQTQVASFGTGFSRDLVFGRLAAVRSCLFLDGIRKMVFKRVRGRRFVLTFEKAVLKLLKQLSLTQ
ncbi:hypothetical protein AVEN_85999-1 [Araneus ventricosus]|uniref:Uncharacterized protein n=1 Tax=Araneus ventricosus TaxID=182803 RepID=A0A4Y2SFZ8_ARAVE|nr:hypothetical protein AVEN_85999-1 [Araneus ventricosus]